MSKISILVFKNSIWYWVTVYVLGDFGFSAGYIVMPLDSDKRLGVFMCESVANTFILKGTETRLQARTLFFQQHLVRWNQIDQCCHGKYPYPLKGYCDKDIAFLSVLLIWDWPEELMLYQMQVITLTHSISFS